MAKPDLQRVAFSPGEFAQLFGKSQTWGYRQIHSQKVNAITEHGRLLNPAKEVERILGTAENYSGMGPTQVAKARFAKMKEEKRNVWRRFVDGQKQGATEKPEPGAIRRPRQATPGEKVLSRFTTRLNKGLER